MNRASNRGPVVRLAVMGTISVIVPCLDDAEFLTACLDALAAQSRPADEVVVVDNGSSDATIDVAQAHGARIVVEPMRGIWPATAAGFDAASGALLARLDADSLPAPDWLAQIERRMSQPDRPTVVTGPGVFYGGTPLQRWIGRRLYLPAYFTLIGALLGHPPVFGSNYAIRREAWLTLRTLVHRNRADLHDDLDLAWWLQPGMSVVRDRALIVGISARPFDTIGELGRRVVMGFRTLAVDWSAWPPMRRRAARRHAARDGFASRGGAASDLDGDGEEPLPA
jgi:glycosyltransferase involved in cell wall biosynthesis